MPHMRGARAGSAAMFAVALLVTPTWTGPVAAHAIVGAGVPQASVGAVSGTAGTVTDSRTPGSFVPVSPARLLDTRTGVGAPGPVKAGSTIHLQVAGRGGVPATGVAAVVLNLTVTAPSRAGYVTAYPDGTVRPTASNLNYVTNQTVADLVTVKVRTNGKVALATTSAGQAQLIADVSGYYADGAVTEPGGFVPVDPARVLDTRTGVGATGPVPAHGTVHLQVAGRGGVPVTGASAVVVTVTVADPAGAGYLTAYPDGTARPTTSSLNFTAHQSVPNLVTVTLGATGKIALTNSSTGTIRLVADLAGYYLAGTATANGMFVPVAPQRLVDTRSGSGATGPVSAGGTIPVPTGALPASDPSAGVAAVVLNVTVTQPRSAGYLTAYPGATSRPVASTLNFAAGQTLANMAVISVGTDGTVVVTNRSGGTAQIVVDVTGFMVFSNLATVGAAGVAAGNRHTCAVTPGGGVKCWGDNHLGQAYGTNPSEPTAHTALADGSGVAEVTAGGDTTCALVVTDDGGSIECWGDNTDGQLGTGTSSPTPSPVAVPVAGIPPAAAVALSLSFGCALTQAGGVWCWGAGGIGPLGTTSTSPAPVPVPGLTSGVVSLAAGERHMCLLTQLGGVECWGQNDSGQLGDGTTSSSSTPHQVNWLPTGVVSLASGATHTCAVTADGGVRCWGSGYRGELGDGTTSSSGHPVPVAGLPARARAVTAAGEHTCALLEAGRVWCWGENPEGQLGSGSITTKELAPVAVAGLDGAATRLGTGPQHSCATLESGALQCWGQNAEGELGNGETRIVRSPVQVTGITSGATAVASGNTSCAIVDGTLRCWGLGAHGAVGTQYIDNYDYQSTPIPAGAAPGTVTSVDTDRQACEVAAGAVLCWGDNTTGELGNGTTVPSTTPIAVPGLSSGMAAVATGVGFSCALSAAGAVSCWGAGALGNGTVTRSLVPVPVTGLSSGVTQITAGLDFACAVKDAGAALCWGADRYGQLGDGTGGHTTPYQTLPAQVLGLTSGVIDIAAGAYHACARTTSGAVLCWGSNAVGQLGSGTVGGLSLVPAPVIGLSAGASAIAAGGTDSCAIASGTLSCWGNNALGQLGTGSASAAAATPQPVTALGTDVSSVSVSSANACAVTDGTINCWGRRDYGALGNGTSTIVPTPTTVLGL